MTDEDKIKKNNSFVPEVSDGQKEGKKSLKRKQKERDIRKKRKKLKGIKRILRFVLFVLIIFSIYEIIKIPQWYLPLDALSKPNKNIIKIVNNNIVPSSVIYDSLKNIQVKKIPIYFMNVRQIKKEILKNPVIKSTFVRRFGFPARIIIVIRERTPIAVIKKDLKMQPIAFLTNDNIMITDQRFMHNAQNPQTLVILTKNFHLGKEWNPQKVNYIGKIAKSVETYSQEKVEYIDMANPNDVYVKIESTSIRLGVLDSSVFERIKRIYTILPQISNIDGKIKYIDLSWDKVNYLKMHEQKSASVIQENDKNKQNEDGQ